MSFNVRVYGILIDSVRGVLVSDELIQGKLYTKFPGGGLEYGEGTKDCLKREFREELCLSIEVKEHIYTTDFFQESAFKARDQLIAIYYRVVPLEKIEILKTHFDTPEEINPTNPHADRESFRFISLEKIKAEDLSFPVDKVVGRMLHEQYIRTQSPIPIRNS